MNRKKKILALVLGLGVVNLANVRAKADDCNGSQQECPPPDVSEITGWGISQAGADWTLDIAQLPKAPPYRPPVSLGYPPFDPWVPPSNVSPGGSTARLCSYDGPCGSITHIENGSCPTTYTWQNTPMGSTPLPSDQMCVGGLVSQAPL